MPSVGVQLYSVVFKMLLKKHILNKGGGVARMPKGMVSQLPWVDISN
jgi:hypothetical protein